MLVSSIASAQTLRWARSGDSLTLDPHAQNEGPTHTLAQRHGRADHAGPRYQLEGAR
jgi:hypothetical protein